ncbi:hypothetical protein RRF68_12745 [Tenacibaculum sp. HL-MS23]|uniref:lipoprotein n=1 Tax=unclassified Tenacibaculum TaxID=2635139 RepID=UPI001C4F7B00|nr:MULTISPECIES: hypothetical protein [unclassified Tenacibaculum]QXP74353.1 hypothetical protein H0I30_04180 [Tenacibaculum sp. AHE14PA]QXP75277.1 hypothetical protein H0I31_08790 [Tenacibaculum sp. AHE15PA]WNW01819.1 hypothetical protein RRF68_12745 [Tenacibaculum sp. HL-MS23]
MKKTLLFTLLLLTLASCSSLRTGVSSIPMYAPKAEINPIRANVDIDMDKKLVGKSTSSYFLLFRVNGDNKFADGMSYSSESKLSGILNARENKTKSSAAYNALHNSGADIIVHPNYVVEIKNYILFKQINVTVSGYAGYFKKFYQKEYSDNDEETVRK